MIANFKNKSELEFLKKYAIEQALTQNVSAADFIDFVNNIQKALIVKHPAELRFDIPTGLDVKSGVIMNACIDYNPTSPSEYKLSIEFQEQTEAPAKTYTFDFSLQGCEVNTMSNTNTHFKCYIKDAEHKVMVGIVIYLNR